MSARKGIPVRHPSRPNWAYAAFQIVRAHPFDGPRSKFSWGARHVSLQCQNIIRAAKSVVAEFGKEAEIEIERNIAGCTKAGYIVMAGIWKEVRTAIVQIRTNEATKISSVDRERSNEP